MSRGCVLRNIQRFCSRAYSQASEAMSASRPEAFSSGFSFELTEEQKQLRDTARKFAIERLIPNAAHYDETSEFPWPIVKEAHANGFVNCVIPQEYGGLGLDTLSSVILYENLSYGCTGMIFPIIINEIALTPLLVAGTEEQKRKYFGRLIEKPIVASFAVTEPSGGSDVGGMKTYSVKDGNEYVINGSKMWISSAGHADFFFVLTRSDRDPKAPRSKAFTAFIVDGDTPGLIRGKKENMMGQRASDTRGITFEDVRVPASNVVGRPGEGFLVAMKSFDVSRPVIAAVANGIASRCLDEASKYALERKAFGKSIADNQGVSFMLADMAMNLELSRLMTYRCAYEVMMGRPGSYYSSIAKCFAADTANMAATNAVQIFGGNGFCKDYPVEKLMRDAKILQIYEGTNQIQRMVISRRLLERVRETGTASLIS